MKQNTTVRTGLLAVEILLAAATLLTQMPALRAEAPPRPEPEYFQMIRNGNAAAVRAAIDRGADVNAKDKNGSSALMTAALYSDASMVSLLLGAGADPNLANGAGATALMWAVPDREKVRLLVKAGANVNARSVVGRTALLIAASQDGGADLVKMLLEHGADPRAVDELKGFPGLMTGGGSATALIEAAKTKDVATLKTLLQQGIDVNAKDRNGNTALSEAALRGNVAAVRLLIGRGAEVNVRVGAPASLTPLILASMRGDAATAKELLKAGADVRATNAKGVNALMWAARSERRKTALIDVLVEAGAPVNALNKAGESALDWALEQGDGAVARRLREHGALRVSRSAESEFEIKPACYTPSPVNMVDVRKAVEKAVVSLEKSDPQFFKKSGCVSCHHQSLPQMAVRTMADRGFSYDMDANKRSMKAVVAFLSPMSEILAQGTDIIPDLPITGGYFLTGLAAAGYPADFLTTALAHNIASKQLADGSWYGWAQRPPLEAGDIRQTVYAMRALQLYGPQGRKKEMDARIQRAVQWLRAAQPDTTDELALQLLGMAWGKGRRDDLQRTAARLLQAQRADGGWGQLPGLNSDAYATGVAMVALSTADVAPVSSAAYQRGVAFLLSTQKEDGTWHVKTRSAAVQPLVDSGFPHGRDQWISAAGTSWAIMALSGQGPADPMLAVRRNWGTGRGD